MIDKITSIKSMEVLDSRGYPTVRVQSVFKMGLQRQQQSHQAHLQANMKLLSFVMATPIDMGVKAY